MQFSGDLQTVRKTIAHLRQAMIDAFLPAEERGARYQEFDTCSMKADESVNKFVFRLEQLLGMAIPALNGDAREAILKQRFIKGMEPDVRRRLYENPVLTYAQSITTAKQLLSASKQVADDGKFGGSVGKPFVEDVKVKSEPMATANAMYRGGQQARMLGSQQNPSTNFNAARLSSTPKCYSCGEVGHINRFCPHRGNSDQQNRLWPNGMHSRYNMPPRQSAHESGSWGRNPSRDGPVTCFVCAESWTQGEGLRVSIWSRTKSADGFHHRTSSQYDECGTTE